LLEDTVEGAWCDVIAGLPCNSNTAKFSAVLKLPMTPLCRDKIPTVIREYPQHLTDFHTANISMMLIRGKVRFLVAD